MKINHCKNTCDLGKKQKYKSNNCLLLEHFTNAQMSSKYELEHEIFSFSNLNSSLGFASSLSFCFLIYKTKIMIATLMGDSKHYLASTCNSQSFPALWHCNMMLWSKNLLGHAHKYLGIHVVHKTQIGQTYLKVFRTSWPIELFKILFWNCGRNLSVWLGE